MPASRLGDCTVADNKKIAFGTDLDFNLVYSSANNRFEIQSAAGTVLAYFTTAGAIVFVGPVDASAFKVGGVAIASTHLSDWSVTGKTTGYLVKWNGTTSKHEYVAAGTALGNYLATLAPVSTARLVVSGSGSVGANATVDLASGVATPGTYRSVTVDTYGRVTAGSNPDIALGSQTSGNYTASVAGTTGRIGVTGAVGEGQAAIVDLASGVATPGTFRSVTVDTYGRVTAGTNPDIALGSETSGNYTASVAGTAGRIGVTGAVGEGQAAVVDLASGVATPGSYNCVTVDTYGRVTSGLVLTKPIVLTAQGATPAITGGCAVPAQIETGTNKVNYWAIDFDAATAEIAWWPNIALPYDYNGGTLTPTVYWTSAAGSAGNVVWGIAGRAYANDEALDQALGTEVTGSDAWIANGDVHVTTLGAVTLGGTPAAGELLMLRLRRVAADAGDTLSGDARVLSVRLEYTPRAS